MKTLKSLFASLIVTAVSMPLIASAHGPLRDSMTDMYASMKVLTNALIKGQPATDEELKTASNDLLKATVTSSKLLPKELLGADGKPTPKKKAEIAIYKDLMTKLLAALTELDQEIKAGKKDSAKAILQGKVAPLQKKGHELFKHENH
jgi:hypothetical protein